MYNIEELDLHLGCSTLFRLIINARLLTAATNCLSGAIHCNGICEIAFKRGYTSKKTCPMGQKLDYTSKNNYSDSLYARIRYLVCLSVNALYDLVRVKNV